MLPLVMQRKAAGLSQAEVGDRVDLSSATISNLEAGQNTRLKHMSAYAGLFGKTVDIQFVDKTDEAA
jgi:transcriptional regulator with XRE-family HTH domain